MSRKTPLDYINMRVLWLICFVVSCIILAAGVICQSEGGIILGAGLLGGDIICLVTEYSVSR